MNLLTRSALCAALVSFAPCATPGQDQEPYGWDCPAMGYLPYRGEFLVTTVQLSRMIDEGRATVVHVGFDEGADPTVRRARYSEGHIPGALFWSWPDLAGSESSPAPLGSHLDVVRALGLTPGDRIVLYDTGLGREAAAAFAALDALGLADRAALLDGQWSKWAFEGRPLSTAAARPDPSDLPVAPSRARMGAGEWRAFLRALRDRESAGTVVVARAGGSRPGAFVPVSWNENLVSPNWPVLRAEGELRRLWAQVPPRAERTLVVAARGWVEAAPVYFAARLLGYPARILDGSIDVENPEIEAGP